MASPRPLPAGALVVGGLGTGVALAGGGHSADPAPERGAEAQYTDAHRADVPVSQDAAEKAALARHQRLGGSDRRHTGNVVRDHLDD
jgi:hypothetical protein